MNGAPTRLLPGLLVAVVLLAGWRTMASTRQVLSGTKPGEITAEKRQILDQEASERRLLSRVATDDSLLGALRNAGRLQDPFHPSPAQRQNTGGPQPPPEPPRLQTPNVVMVIIEPTRQEVILRMGGQESPRLRAGSVWRGWTINRIGRDVVKIESLDHQKEDLPVPNLNR